LIVLVCLFLWMDADASESGIDFYFGGWSTHYQNDNWTESPYKNSSHELIGIKFQDYVAATFMNSFGDRAYLVGKSFNIFEVKRIDFNVLAVAVYGYEYCTSGKNRDTVKTCPQIMFSIEAQDYSFSPAILLNGEAAMMTFKVSF